MLRNSMIASIMKMTPQGVGKWRKEERPILKLLDKYFTKEDIEQFLEEGFIPRFEILEDMEEYQERTAKKMDASLKILNLDLDELAYYLDWQDAKIITQIYFNIDTDFFFTDETDLDYKEKFQNEYSINLITLDMYINNLDSSFKKYFTGSVFALASLDEKEQAFFIRSRLLQMKELYECYGVEIEKKYEKLFQEKIEN